MKDIIAIRHVNFEHLGTLEPLLKQMGFAIHYQEAGVIDLSKLDAAKPDLLVVLGGPIGAYEEHNYPWLNDELRLIERRLAKELPLLGICLGAQLIARALGSKVYPNCAKEIGWKPLSLTAEGQNSCLAELRACNYQVLHWHGDTFDLPVGAQLLASTDLTANQAFAYGATTLGLQFHLEIDVTDIERWLIGHTHELATNNINLTTLRQDSFRYGTILAASAAQCIMRWLIAH